MAEKIILLLDREISGLKERVFLNMSKIANNLAEIKRNINSKSFDDLKDLTINFLEMNKELLNENNDYINKLNYLQSRQSIYIDFSDELGGLKDDDIVDEFCELLRQNLITNWMEFLTGTNIEFLNKLIGHLNSKEDQKLLSKLMTQIQMN